MASTIYPCGFPDDRERPCSAISLSSSAASQPVMNEACVSDQYYLWRITSRPDSRRWAADCFLCVCVCGYWGNSFIVHLMYVKAGPCLITIVGFVSTPCKPGSDVLMLYGCSLIRKMDGSFDWQIVKAVETRWLEHKYSMQKTPRRLVLNQVWFSRPAPMTCNTVPTPPPAHMAN